jgi:hypothetical protein
MAKNWNARITNKVFDLQILEVEISRGPQFWSQSRGLEVQRKPSAQFPFLSEHRLNAVLFINLSRPASALAYAYHRLPSPYFSNNHSKLLNVFGG